MCGICGVIRFNGSVPERRLLEKMSQTIKHRGPDDQGFYVAPSIGLAQQRLSIIDLSCRALAPLSNEDETIWVVFNGEIYNFQELRELLSGRGHTFRSATDTEVLVHLYEEHGTECLQYLRGMFAFALWDSRKQLLFAARDRLGKKPFFYTNTGRSFVFGSEIKAITANPEVSVAPNFQAIDRYLTYQYVPSPLSAFEDIYKLPAAHYLTCKASGEIAVQRYWSPPASTTIRPNSDEGEIATELVEQLRTSVRLRMVADVPLGAFLSGGIDSTTVVALMAQESAHPIKTFSIGFEEEAFNELPYARLLAERYGTEHHEFMVRPNAAEILPLLVRHYNEPFADSSAIPTYYVSKMTRQHVTVALSGDGGDESFGGYARYGQMMEWSRSDAVPYVLRRMIAGGAQGGLERLYRSNIAAKLSRAFFMLGSRLPERYDLAMTIFKPQEKRAAYTAKFCDLQERGTSQQTTLKGIVWDVPWRCEEDALHWMMRHDQSTYLPDCLMVKSDIASMANSLEVRAPLLDHKFMEFAATIPSALKRDGNEGKVILKKAVRHLLPEEILTKRKSGFSVPLAKWLCTDLAGLMREVLLSQRALRRDLFQPEFVRGMVEQHISGRRDWSNRLWALLLLEMWFREFID